MVTKVDEIIENNLRNTSKIGYLPYLNRKDFLLKEFTGLAHCYLATTLENLKQKNPYLLKNTGSICDQF